MKRFLLGVFAALCAGVSAAQTVTLNGQTFTVPGTYAQFGTIGATGPLPINFFFVNGPLPPNTYTVAWSNKGTSASNCTLQVQGSVDNGDSWINVTPVTDCTAVPPSGGAAIVVQDTPFSALRVYVASYTPGDATTAITVSFARGN